MRLPAIEPYSQCQNAAMNLRPGVPRSLRVEAGALAVEKSTVKLRPVKREPNAVKNR